MLRLVLPLLVTAMLSGCGKFIYGVDVLNYGQSGVLILQMGNEKSTGLHPAFVKLGVMVPIIRGLYPAIPSKYRDPTSGIGYFVGYPHSLPKEVELVWQLAELKECETELWANRPVQYRPQDTSEAARKVWDEAREKRLDEIKKLGYAPENHWVKSGCTWLPLPDKIYRQKLDMQALRDSEAYKKTGRRNPNVAMSRYTLNLELIFNEDQLTVKADNGATNPWK